MSTKQPTTDEPFKQDPSRNHRDQVNQDPRDNLMFGVRDMDDVDASGNHHDRYEEYILATEQDVIIKREDERDGR